LRALTPGDTVVVKTLDRLGRSLVHLLTIVTDLAERGVRFRSLTEGIDTTTPAGRMFSIFGALVEFEQSLIREGTEAGLAAARTFGRTLGQPSMYRALRASSSAERAGL